MPPPPDGHLSVQALKARGWTATLITRLLGSPDATVPNPHYRSVAPMRLYALARVEACEHDPGWTALLAQTRARQISAQQAVATKQAQLLAALAHRPVLVPILPLDVLIQRACQHYNLRHAEHPWWDDAGYWRPATPESDPAFLARISVNQALHQILTKAQSRMGWVRLHGAQTATRLGGVGDTDSRTTRS